MKQRAFIFVAALIATMILGSIAVYAYDSSRDDTIAEGITIAGIDVGGMESEEARQKLRERLETPLAEPLEVRYRGERWRLSAERAGLVIDVGGMVSDALKESREGNVVTRSFRNITGGEVSADVEARIAYDRPAVDRLVRRIRGEVDQEAQDASVEPSGDGLARVEGRNGVALRTGPLVEAINAELTDPGEDRIVKARTRVTKPEVTKDELAERYPHYITISRSAKRLRYYRNLELVKTYTIAVGTVGFETPAGLYNIQNKAVNAAWSVPEWGGELAGKVIPGGAPNNPLKARWLGIYDGAGIHGTDDIGSLGTAASHGCIRMAIPEVIELYDRVPVGAPVYIA